MFMAQRYIFLTELASKVIIFPTELLDKTNIFPTELAGKVNIFPTKLARCCSEQPPFLGIAQIAVTP